MPSLVSKPAVVVNGKLRSIPIKINSMKPLSCSLLHSYNLGRLRDALPCCGHISPAHQPFSRVHGWNSRAFELYAEGGCPTPGRAGGRVEQAGGSGQLTAHGYEDRSVVQADRTEQAAGRGLATTARSVRRVGTKAVRQFDGSRVRWFGGTEQSRQLAVSSWQQTNRNSVRESEGGTASR